jgi:hypothetical protein
MSLWGTLWEIGIMFCLGLRFGFPFQNAASENGLETTQANFGARLWELYYVAPDRFLSFRNIDIILAKCSLWLVIAVHVV